MLSIKSFKVYIIAIVFLTISFSALVQGQTAKNICAEEDFDAMIIEANKGIKFSQYNIEAYLKRGYAYTGKIEYDKALADFNCVLEIHPKSERAFYSLGIIYLKRGNYNQAIVNFSAAIEINPDNFVNYYERGRTYIYKNENNLAMEDFHRAVILDAENAYAYYGRGRQNFIAGQKELGINDLNKVIEILSKKIELNEDSCQNENYLLRGIAYAVLNNTQQSLNDYNKSITVKSNEQAYYYRGQLHIRKKSYKEAVADFSKAIELNSQFAESYKQRAVAYEKLKETAKAESDIQKYRELSGN